jgi:hypothetical protein
LVKSCQIAPTQYLWVSALKRRIITIIRQRLLINSVINLAFILRIFFWVTKLIENLLILFFLESMSSLMIFISLLIHFQVALIADNHYYFFLFLFFFFLRRSFNLWLLSLSATQLWIFLLIIEILEIWIIHLSRYVILLKILLLRVLKLLFSNFDILFFLLFRFFKLSYSP